MGSTTYPQHAGASPASPIFLVCAGALAALVQAGCAVEADAGDEGGAREGSAAAPIRGGYADLFRDAVVGLRMFGETGRRTCSGVLIAPNLVLTAQHCVARSPGRVACPTATFGDLVEPDRVHVTSSVLICERCDTPWFSVSEVARPPGEDDRFCGNDVALLVLDSPVPREYAAPLSPRLDEPPEEGELYSAVGFGRTDALRRDSGVRRNLDWLHVACVGAGCGEGERVAPSEWRGETGACKGDSGGPALDVFEQVIGVSSRGRADCDRPIYSGLVAHREWIRDEAWRAASIGGYTPPAWVTGGFTAAAAQ
ncbi:S1 family peptidase [Sorangium sp. So ce131]|uniref:S1 family peptidase n=1 Tax=Sorangium sp. So ce131 TaxID=3133282 RepID=UPI003F627521